MKLIPEEQERTITLLNWEKHNLLSKHDYAWLAERGYALFRGKQGKGKIAVLI